VDAAQSLAAAAGGSCAVYLLRKWITSGAGAAHPLHTACRPAAYSCWARLVLTWATLGLPESIRKLGRRPGSRLSPPAPPASGGTAALSRLAMFV